MTKTNTKRMTTLYFRDYYGYGRTIEFLGLDARPKDCDARPEDCDGTRHTLRTAVASPAQIAKIKRAIADGVRYEVKHVKGNAMRPNTVRVRTYGPHKVEVRQDIERWTELLVQQCLRSVDYADRLASDHANPQPPRFHKEHVLSLEHTLKWLTGTLSRRVCGYIDPAFMKYPKRGRKSPSTV